MFAHEEANAINPLVGAAHYRGGKSLIGHDIPGQRDQLGVAVARQDLETASVDVEKG